MRFPAKKKAGCPKAPRDFPPKTGGILHPPWVVLDPPPPPPESVRTGVRKSADLTTKIAWQTNFVFTTGYDNSVNQTVK